MKVEPSGVIFVGNCEIQSQNCLAKVSGPVTAIWTPPGRTQVNVCHTCLDEQLRCGKWEITGTRIERPTNFGGINGQFRRGRSAIVEAAV